MTNGPQVSSFDYQNKSLSHETRIKTNLQAFKCEIAKVAPSFLKMVQGNEEGTWFKMQVWMVQYLIHDFKESDSAIIDEHDPEVFKTRLVQEDGWDADTKHGR
jgi:ABC-type Zn uptake system ZnuABC Zn-binding protein ZnuA